MQFKVCDSPASSQKVAGGGVEGSGDVGNGFCQLVF